MNWNTLSEEAQVDIIIRDSFQSPQLIFKHSTRCSISIMAKSRLERSIQPSHIHFHYLDLLNYRSVSNYIAERLSVFHESPQVLLINKGECVFVEAHNAINMDEIIEQVNG